MAGDTTKSVSDPFSSFWTEFMSRMWSAVPGASAAPPPSPSQEMMNQMRRVFFDAMAAHADQFMRSEAFLNSMKQSMDNALAWQQMMNQYLQKGVSATQMPSQADADHVVLLVRGMEDRVMKKLEELEKRVDRVDGSKAAKPAAKTKARTRK